MNGERLLTSMKAQGLPLENIYSIFFGCKESSKKMVARKKYVQRMMNAEFPTSHSKMYDGNIENDYKVLLRFMCSSGISCPRYISSLPRSYMLSENGWEFSSLTNEMKITGFVRNAPLVTSHQVHISNLGTFAIKRIEETTSKKILAEYFNNENDGIVFANPNVLDGEQNLIGFDCTDKLEEEHNEEQKQPNDYQSAWLDELLDSKDLAEHKSLTETFNTAPSNMEEDDTLVQRRHEEYKKFPDEIELKPEEDARNRLSRYRSMKSFRNSFWDPKENLPDDYGRIFQFENFRATEKDVLSDLEKSIQHNIENDDDDATMSATDDVQYIPVGTLITLAIQIKDPIHIERLKKCNSLHIFSVSSLLPHENKVSSLQFSISVVADWEGSIKSKDILTIRCGWRTWQCRPLFSFENLNSNKHKLEKYMPLKGFFTLTAYGPVTYTPCNVLVFKNQDLVATGQLKDANADRIILKKINLTGFPSRVNKRWATVKYMFYNPQDVKWFKPAGLITKHGLQGTIYDTIGDHGSMKCLFNQPIKQHDTVCLPLYKRVYPKFIVSNKEHDDMQDSSTHFTSKRNLLVW